MKDGSRMTDQRFEDQPTSIFGGVDTHHDFHVVAALNAFGAKLGHATFAATTAGYGELLDWLRQWGPVATVGVEGTGSYGAGLARFLAERGVQVVEVNRPDRAERRRRGKSDPFDAENAARAAIAGHATAHPKARTGPVESIRALKLQRDSAKKARTAALNQMHNLVLTAPAALREQLEGLTKKTLPQRCIRLRPGANLSDPTPATKRALRGLARRVQALDEEINDLDTDLATLVTTVAPRTIAAYCAGTDVVAQLLITVGDNPERFKSEAAFAHLCGVSPIPASSGRTNRHRLNRGGDRQANRALHIVALARQSHHQPTRDYKDRRTHQGLTGRDINRCLKRHIARELFQLIRDDLLALTHGTEPIPNAA